MRWYSEAAAGFGPPRFSDIPLPGARVRLPVVDPKFPPCRAVQKNAAQHFGKWASRKLSPQSMPPAGNRYYCKCGFFRESPHALAYARQYFLPGAGLLQAPYCSLRADVRGWLYGSEDAPG